MGLLSWTYLIVLVSFSILFLISWKTRSGETKGFYVARAAISPITFGMAIAADWISAATFMSIAGIMAASGFSGTVYVMGWTGGYVLLALVLAPYLRKFGKFTVPDFIRDRYYSDGARVIAVLCVLVISFVYITAQLRGVGIVFSRFLQVDIFWGSIIGAFIVLLYALAGGLKTGTLSQATQYIIIILAFMLPAGVIAYLLVGNPIPQLALGSSLPGNAKPFIQVLDEISVAAQFPEFTRAFQSKNVLDTFCTILVLMVGTAGLPHIIAKFYSISSASSARLSAAYALLFIAILYTAAPAVGAFGRLALLKDVENKTVVESPQWVASWERTGLISRENKEKPAHIKFRMYESADQSRIESKNAPTVISVDPDMIVLAMPEMYSLPPWLGGLLVTGALIAALSTAAGLLLVIGSSFSYDLYYRLIDPKAPEKKQSWLGRGAMVVTVFFGSICSLFPPAPIVQVVAFAFGLAAATFFPAMILGIFWRRTTTQGAIAGMLTGALFTGLYILQVTATGGPYWFLGISPEGMGAVGMLLNFAVAITVSKYTPAPPMYVQEFVDSIKNPSISSVEPFGRSFFGLPRK